MFEIMFCCGCNSFVCMLYRISYSPVVKICYVNIRCNSLDSLCCVYLTFTLTTDDNQYFRYAYVRTVF